MKVRVVYSNRPIPDLIFVKRSDSVGRGYFVNETTLSEINSDHGTLTGWPKTPCSKTRSAEPKTALASGIDV